MKFNFVSIPRCSSQSIHNAFRTEKYMNHKGISLFEDSSLPSFAVIREPADRIRSWYVWHRMHKKLHDWYPETFEQWCIDGFITHWTPKDCKQMGITNALKQKDYITADGVIMVDCLIDYRKLNKGLRLFAAKQGTKLGTILKMGRTEKIPISDTVKILIMSEFQEDIELYERVKCQEL